MTLSKQTSPYIGRFAPSPSGPLHIGSLITAVASYLDAKKNNGQWLVRMEDLDPPREEHGAKERILHSLQQHGLRWDGNIMYQSERLDAYEAALTLLKPYTYPCCCSRPRLTTLNGIYDGHCLQHPLDQAQSLMTSTRVMIDALPTKHLQTAEHYEDIFQGLRQQSLKDCVGDFILRRKDTLFAYQLAVVVDDIHQHITHVIRGSDLLSSTPRQRYLYQLLTLRIEDEKKIHPQRSFNSPTYGHLPVATNAQGQKLSKQHKATPINDDTAFDNLCFALAFLQHPVPNNIVVTKNIDRLLAWGVQHWDRKSIPHAMSFVVETE